MKGISSSAVTRGNRSKTRNLNLRFHEVEVQVGDYPPIVGEGQGDRAVIHVLRECISNVPAISLVLPAVDDNGSLGFLRRRGVYPPGATLGDCLPFPCGE